MATLIQELQNTQKSNAALAAKLDATATRLNDVEQAIATAAQATVNIVGELIQVLNGDGPSEDPESQAAVDALAEQIKAKTDELSETVSQSQ